MNALVTGGAGFIGSHLVEALLAGGNRVRVLDDLSTGRRASLSLAAVDLRVGDVRDPAVVRQAMEGMEVVFHLAARPSTGASIADPVTCHQVNLTGTLEVLQAARAAVARRVVFASSCAVYGEQAATRLHERLRPQPLSPYGVAKLAGEHYSTVFARQYGLETVSLRYFNVYGPGQDPRGAYAAVIPRFVQAAVEGAALEVHGDGGQTRDFVAVPDVVAATLAAATAPGVAGAALNVASGEGRSILDLVRALERLLGRPLEVRHTPARPGDVRNAAADTRAARDLLGFEARVRLEDGLRTMLGLPAAPRPGPSGRPGRRRGAAAGRSAGGPGRGGRSAGDDQMVGVDEAAVERVLGDLQADRP